MTYISATECRATGSERLEVADILEPSFLSDLAAAHFAEAIGDLGWPVEAM
jgi:hypothetical protein